MPEQLTRHPEVTLQVLRSAGAQCGEGAAQQILTRCPAERFCKLPGGEICVYGLPEAYQMTQISAADWQALGARAGTVASAPARAAADAPPAAPDDPAFGAFMVAAAALVAGALVGAAAMHWVRRRGRRTR